MDPFNTIIQINLVGTFRCIAHSAAGMMSLDPNTDDGGRGAVVNTASVAAEDGQIGQSLHIRPQRWNSQTRLFLLQEIYPVKALE